MSSWIKVYNSMPQNPKILMAGDRAAWLSVCGLCYSNEHLTDGFIPAHALPVVAPGVRRPESLAAQLVAAGLWHVVEGGWRIHDYEKHQRSAEEIRDSRARDAARKAKVRADSNGSPANVRADSERNPEGVRDVRVEVEEKKNCSRGKTALETPFSSGRGAPDKEDEKATDDDRRLCRLLAEQMIARNPKEKVKSRSQWLRQMRLLREKDGNSPEEIERVIRWLFSDPSKTANFWADVIRSSDNLREHFPTLWQKMTGQRQFEVVEDSAAFLARRGAA